MDNALIRKSKQAFAFFLKFYPESFSREFGKEMEFVFSESLKETYQKHQERGVLSLWGRTLVDLTKSLIIQNINNQKGSMKAKNTDFIMDNKVFVLLALATGLILLIPLVAMQLSSEWNWGLADFIIIGALLFGSGSIFILLARKVRSTMQRLAIGVAVLAAVLYIWAELAVGIFTNLGS